MLGPVAVEGAAVSVEQVVASAAGCDVHVAWARADKFALFNAVTETTSAAESVFAV